MGQQFLPLRVEILVGRDLLRVEVGIVGRRGGSWSAVVGLHAPAAEGDAFVYVGGDGGVEAVLGHELLSQSQVLVVLVEEDAVGAEGVDLDLDDGCMGGGVPMSGPRELARL